MEINYNIDQLVLFGDSITSHSIEQADGFSLHAALQEGLAHYCDGETTLSILRLTVM